MRRPASGMLRAAYGAPRRKTLGARRAFSHPHREQCRVGKIGYGSAYELSYDPKSRTYHVAVVSAVVRDAREVVMLDTQRSREFPAKGNHQRLILRARDEALAYLQMLGASIPAYLLATT